MCCNELGSFIERSTDSNNRRKRRYIDTESIRIIKLSHIYQSIVTQAKIVVLWRDRTWGTKQRSANVNPLPTQKSPTDVSFNTRSTATNEGICWLRVQTKSKSKQTKKKQNNLQDQHWWMSLPKHSYHHLLQHICSILANFEVVVYLQILFFVFGMFWFILRIANNNKK